MLGQSAANIITSGDAVQDKNNARTLPEALRADESLGPGEPMADQVLYIGADNWPFPIAAEERRSRTVVLRYQGRRAGNPLSAASARMNWRHSGLQRAGRWRSRSISRRRTTADTIHQYAQKIHQRGRQAERTLLEGCRRPAGESDRPAGGLRQRRKGYGGENATPQPFHGYYFQVLTAQGATRRAAPRAIWLTAR